MSKQHDAHIRTTHRYLARWVTHKLSLWRRLQLSRPPIYWVRKQVLHQCAAALGVRRD